MSGPGSQNPPWRRRRKIGNRRQLRRRGAHERAVSFDHRDGVATIPRSDTDETSVARRLPDLAGGADRAGVSDEAG
jgi:hypothetical protein